MKNWVLFWALGLGVFVGAARAENAEDRAGIQFFETSIRPLLIENCYSCHGEKKQKGELRLDSRSAALRGGELGAVIIPGKPDDSLLIKAVRYLDPDLSMPPKKKLSQKQVDDLTKWVATGEPMPGDERGCHARRSGRQD
jgi:mono/diheme cytochrome c family protein